MAEFPLWIVFVIQALCPDSKAPLITIASIPLDGRDLLVIPLAIYYLASWTFKTLKTKESSKKIKSSELAAAIKKPWHNHIPFLSVLIILYQILSLDWSRLDNINTLAMIYTSILTGMSILAGFMFIQTKNSKEKIYNVLWSITVFIAAISIVYTILTFFSLLHLGGLKTSVDIENVGRVKGPFFGVASAYFILVPAIGFTIQKIIDSHKKPWLDLTVCFALMITLVGTGSRGGILSFLIFILLIFPSAKDKKKAAKILILLTLVVMTTLGIYYSKSEKVAARVQSTESVDRESTYKTSLQIILNRSTKENIFGSGYASYWPWYLPQALGRNRETGVVWVPFGEILYKPHSLFLSFWVELGLFGLIYYLWLWITLFKLYARNFISTKTPLLNSALLASFVCTFFETPIVAMPGLATAWWIFTFGALFLNTKTNKSLTHKQLRFRVNEKMLINRPVAEKIGYQN